MKLDRSDPTSCVNLARLEVSSGNRDEAAKLFAEALTLDLASTPARAGLQQARAAR
jgi:hypothetical protein